MQILRQLIGFILVLWVSTMVLASPNDDLTRLLLNMHSMQADFEQTLTDTASHKIIQQSKGHVALVRPGKFRWETTEPTVQVIVTNGKKLWIVDPDLEQVIIRSFHQAANQTPALLLSDKNLALASNFTIKTINSPEQIAQYRQFLLVPKDPDDVFASIQLIFHRNQISEMSLKDKMGHHTQIFFKNEVINQSIPANLFTFKPSAHIDVIDETRDKF